VTVAVYLPLVTAALLGLVAPMMARSLTPATAARALTGAAVLTALATSFVLGVLAFTLVGLAAPVAALGRWSTATLAAADPVPQLVAGLACGAVVVLAAAGVHVLIAWIRSLATAHHLCRSLGGQAGQLLVIEDGAEDVFAVPAAGGRIVASRSLLAALPADRRRALLAHEAAHLHHHHSLLRIASELAAAVNPLLRPVTTAVRFATERWADEEAARVVGDRCVVASTLAQLSLRRHDDRRRSGAARTRDRWHSTDGDAAASPVRARVQALLGPAPRQRPVAALVLAALLVVTVAASVDTQRDAEHLFEQSRTPISLAAGVVVLHR
jgi:Zn-dependent protease with chaperone function